MKKLLMITAMALALSAPAYAQSAPDNGNGQQTQSQDARPQDMHHHDHFADLSPQGQQIMKTTMHKAHEGNKALWEQGKKLHEQLHAILTADTFDQKAFVAKQAELAKLHARMHASMTQSFAAALAQLSPEDRNAIAADMEKHHHKHDGHGQKDNKDDSSNQPAGGDQDQ